MSNKVRLVVAKPISPSTEASLETLQVAEVTKGKRRSKGSAKVNAAAVPGLVQRGPLLLTRQGMSGPAVLKLSAFGARIMNATNYKYDHDASLLHQVFSAAI